MYLSSEENPWLFGLCRCSVYRGAYYCWIGPSMNPFGKPFEFQSVEWDGSDKGCSFMDRMKNVTKEKSIETWTRSIVSMKQTVFRSCSLPCWLCVLASTCFWCERWFMSHESKNVCVYICLFNIYIYLNVCRILFTYLYDSIILTYYCHSIFHAIIIKM